METQDLQPVGSFPSTTNENTFSGDNTENQDTTSGNTSNTENNTQELPVFQLSFPN